MPPVRRVVVDLLKPHDPELPAFARRVAAGETVEGVNATLVETDREVENVKLTVEGADVDVAAVEATVEDLGGTLHSVDEVAVGERLVEESRTLQDPRP